MQERNISVMTMEPTSDQASDYTESLFDTSVEGEYMEARERFKPLIDAVAARRENPEFSTCAGDENKEVRESLAAHDGEVLKIAIKFGMARGLSQTSLRELEVIAILHDMMKRTKLPDSFSEEEKRAIGEAYLPMDVLMHAEWASSKIRSLVDDPDIMDKIFVDDDGKSIPYNHHEKEGMIAHMETAIRAHNGPNPGFMGDLLGSTNKKIDVINEVLEGEGLDSNLKHIEHTSPPPGDLIAETLLYADMTALGTQIGRQKIVSDRSRSPGFVSEDVATSSEFRRLGVSLSPAEAAFLSSDKSAQDGLAMIKDPRIHALAESMLESALNVEYRYVDPQGLEYTIKPHEALEKRDKYLEALKRDTREIQTVE